MSYAVTVSSAKKNDQDKIILIGVFDRLEADAGKTRLLAPGQSVTIDLERGQHIKLLEARDPLNFGE